MTIEEGLKLEGYPAEIPDCSRDDLPEFFKRQGCKIGVEIGVFEARFTLMFAQAGLEIHGVDPWTVYEDYGHPDYLPVAEKRYQKSLRRLKDFPNAFVYRETSMEALRHFDDESIDFVYIDGNHQFRYIADDIYEWWKKVRKGGFICGHDYAYFKSRSPCGGCQVREIVDAYSKSFHKNFWVLGRKKVIEGEVRDRYRSWIFIKGDERDPKP